MILIDAQVVEEADKNEQRQQHATLYEPDEKDDFFATDTVLYEFHDINYLTSIFLTTTVKTQHFFLSELMSYKISKNICQSVI